MFRVVLGLGIGIGVGIEKWQVFGGSWGSTLSLTSAVSVSVSVRIRVIFKDKD
jgi:hypothetical protein